MICEVCGEESCGAHWDDPMGAASPGEYEEAMIRHWRLGYERSRSSLAAVEKERDEALATYHAQVDATGAAQQAADGVRERVRERVRELEGALRAAELVLMVLEKGDQARPVVMVSGLIAKARAVVNEVLAGASPSAPMELP